jgi:tetraacyldisaccharide 4'-kinase
LFPFWRYFAWVVLYPLACFWALSMRLRRWLRGLFPAFEPRRRTIGVGNIHGGGSGKTPIVLALAERFSALSPVIISRGYRGALSHLGSRVDPSVQFGPSLYGDEPWMLARRLGVPVYIGKDRVKSMQKAQSDSEGGLFLLDDAFQNLTYRHDIDLVAIQTNRCAQETDCHPLGMLRESLCELRRASAVVLVEGTYLEAWRAIVGGVAPHVPVFTAKIFSEGLWSDQGQVVKDKQERFGAFCGVANPESFRSSVLTQGYPVFFSAYGDHFAYTEKSVAEILEKAEKNALSYLITTEKDWHKLLPYFRVKTCPELLYLRIGYGFSDDFWYFLNARLNLT